MDEKDIRKYASLMKELELTGLEITDENRKVRLERAGSCVSVPETTRYVAEAAIAPKNDETRQDNSCVNVKSPIVGVFYAAPAENAEPFVRLGDKVERGATLCIVEAMKMMNEISAEESGVIDEIYVTNGQVVDYGTQLFRIRRDV